MKLIQGIPPHADDWYVQHARSLYGPYCKDDALELTVQLGSDFPSPSLSSRTRKKATWKAIMRDLKARQQHAELQFRPG